MKKIPLTQGKFALVDDDMFDELNNFKWSFLSSGYARRAVGQKSILMHRELLDAPSGINVDHVNGNKLDNRRCNLRLCSASQNGANSKISNNNTSGYKGVSWDKSKNKWYAKVTHNRKQIPLGRYDDVEDASKAYQLASSKLFGDFARVS